MKIKYILSILMLIFFVSIAPAQNVTCPPPIVNGSWVNNYTIYSNGTPWSNMLNSVKCGNPPLIDYFFMVLYISILILTNVQERSIHRFATGALIGMFLSFLFIMFGLLAPSVAMLTISIWAISMIVAYWLS
ncbi:MAG: hypothetical protein ACP5L3_06540 [Caldisericum sp.]|uniref:hypothetical protein n=1 Tax=Caldisericum sp. TaxID=2499687 RepID=UPI003D0F7F71